MSNSNTQRRIYVACLAAYNNGKLHGAWLDVNGKSADELGEEVAAMLRASPEPGAEEFAIHDSEGLGRVAEYTPLTEVAELAEAIGKHGEIILKLRDHGVASDIAGTVEYHEENYAGGWRSLEEWAEEFLDDTGMFQGASDTLKTYFDYARWAHDAELGGDVFTEEVDGMVHVWWNH